LAYLYVIASIAMAGGSSDADGVRVCSLFNRNQLSGTIPASLGNLKLSMYAIEKSSIRTRA
jgi:hypothetical protein